VTENNNRPGPGGFMEDQEQQPPTLEEQLEEAHRQIAVMTLQLRVDRGQPISYVISINSPGLYAVTYHDTELTFNNIPADRVRVEYSEGGEVIDEPTKSN
jgi:hypothetical protein